MNIRTLYALLSVLAFVVTALLLMAAGTTFTGVAHVVAGTSRWV